jgi:hypothetical protein
MAWVRARLCKLQKGCTRLAAASDKVYQLLAHGRWFSPASSTTKTGRHDIGEILLKVALKTKNQSIKDLQQQIKWKTKKEFHTVRVNPLAAHYTETKDWATRNLLKPG